MLIGASGFVVGTLSFVSPEKSIQLYQWIMKLFNWHVEPVNLRKEIRNTRILGALMTALSVVIFVVLLKY